MSREIKFRAWHEQEERYYMLEKQKYLGGTAIDDPYVGNEMASWEQYTGLKDKNGVEVYEGDIVAYRGRNEYWTAGGGHHIEDRISNIVWDNEDARFDSPLYHTVHSTFWISQLESYGEVIGNIHKNPELLK